MNSKLTIILEPEEDGGYSVHCPVLPGCSSQGDTPEEALSNIREAITGYLASLKQHGERVPKETAAIITREIKEILAGRAADGLPLTIETRVVELPAEVMV
jgi:antitoxin HicB